MDGKRPKSLDHVWRHLGVKRSHPITVSSNSSATMQWSLFSSGASSSNRNWPSCLHVPY